MTTPDVPLRLELSFELPGTPEQVWDAIATAGGISSWFLPTELEERAGGAVTFHMGETNSEGTVTAWEPPSRIEFVEPDWAELTGHEGAAVTPMVSEFLVEAQSGGSCVLRVVTSAFGSGAEWEREFWEDMERHYVPFFDNLRLYLSDFPGQRATQLSVEVPVPGSPDTVREAMRAELGALEVGHTVEAQGVRGRVHRIGEIDFLIRLTDPVPGYLGFTAHDRDGGATGVVAGWLFSDDAPSYVERATPSWKSWVEALAVVVP
jgi:uncharacterized protein YndB with AHSA1/START domain